MDIIKLQYIIESCKRTIVQEIGFNIYKTSDPGGWIAEIIRFDCSRSVDYTNSSNIAIKYTRFKIKPVLNNSTLPDILSVYQGEMLLDEIIDSLATYKITPITPAELHMHLFNLSENVKRMLGC